MKAIVGLGNPGAEYERTRHNIGFEVVDEIARRWGVRLKPWKGVARLAVAAERGAVLAEPTTLMNLSGEAVGELTRYFKIELADVLVVLDEIQLPLGKLRARTQGSAGGHNGLKSIIEHVGDEFARLRLGVGRGDERRDLADHVLARFDQDERAEAERMVMRAADAAEMFTAEGIASVMNTYNGGDRATIE